jgi:hypothetical protein
VGASVFAITAGTVAATSGGVGVSVADGAALPEKTFLKTKNPATNSKTITIIPAAPPYNMNGEMFARFTGCASFK